MLNLAPMSCAISLNWRDRGNIFIFCLSSCIYPVFHEYDHGKQSLYLFHYLYFEQFCNFIFLGRHSFSIFFTIALNFRHNCASMAKAWGIF